MKRIVLVAALMALPVVANAASSAQDGQSFRGVTQIDLGGGMLRADSSAKAFTMSTTGGLSIFDEDRDRDKSTTWTLITTDSTSAAESSAVITVAGYHNFVLYAKLWPINHQASTYKPNVRLAVQVRRHLNGNADSMSTFPIYQYGVGALGLSTSVAKGDTLVTGHVTSGSASLPWSGEFVVDYLGSRASPANGASANAFSYPNGISIDLSSVFGKEIRAKYLSVRVRIINTDAWKWGGVWTLEGFAK